MTNFEHREVAELPAGTEQTGKDKLNLLALQTEPDHLTAGTAINGKAPEMQLASVLSTYWDANILLGAAEGAFPRHEHIDPCRRVSWQIEGCPPRNRPHALPPRQPNRWYY